MRKKEIIKWLEEALQYAKMEKAYFGDDTAHVIEATKSFREAHIIYYIEQALEEVKHTNKKKLIERFIRDAMKGSSFEALNLGSNTQHIIKVTRPYRDYWIYYRLTEALHSLKGRRRE